MLGNILGKRSANFVKSWATSGVFFGSAAGCGFLYITDWKLFLQYLPIYNTKFKDEEDK